MPAQRTNTFRFESTSAFLTYPRCTLTKEQVLDALSAKLDIKFYRIARELHEDGTPHIHAVVKLNRQLRTRDQRYFDIDGFHPNIQTPRSLKNVCEYVSKDGDVLDTFPASSTKHSWADILPACTTRDEFLVHMRTHFPRDFIINLDRILNFADYHYKPVLPPYVNDYDFTAVPEPLLEWLSGNLIRPTPGTKPFFYFRPVMFSSRLALNSNPKYAACSAAPSHSS